jgi:hypothetical protein
VKYNLGGDVMKKGIYSKTVIQSLVVALALGSSALVLANPTNTAENDVGQQVAQATADADNGGVAANEASSVVGIADSYSGNDMSTNDSGNTDASLTDSGNTDASLTDSANTDASLTDSGNTDNSLTDSGNTDNSTNDSFNTDASLTDSGNTDASLTDSGNTDASLTDSGNTDNSIGDISMAIAMSELSGVVTGNYFDAPDLSIFETGDNTMGSESMNSASGITQVSMNTGFQSLSQQSVNVQANLNVGP